MKNEEMMKSGSVWKAIASMAIPSAVIMILMIFYNIADMFFIARLGDNAQVAAVSVVSPVFSMVSADRTGRRMDRQPDRQGRQLGTLRQSDRRTYRRRTGRLDILAFRMGARRHAGQPGHGRHRLGRPAVDRGARLAPQGTRTVISCCGVRLRRNDKNGCGNLRKRITASVFIEPCGFCRSVYCRCGR